jgi:hypothetical protein
MTAPTLEAGTPESMLDNQIEPFLKHLRAAGSPLLCTALRSFFRFLLKV